MTVRELIDNLLQITDKDKLVYLGYMKERNGISFITEYDRGVEIRGEMRIL